MTTTLHTHDTDCATCGQRAEFRRCDRCGMRGIITDCGHRSQPRPLAASSMRPGWTTCKDCECELSDEQEDD